MPEKVKYGDKRMWTRWQFATVLNWCHKCGAKTEHCEGGSIETVNWAGRPSQDYHPPHDSHVWLYECSKCGHEFCYGCLHNHGCWEVDS